MKATKRQLRRIIREEYDAYSIEAIRERGQVSEMADEVNDIMNSMGPGAFSGKEAFDMIWDAFGSNESEFWYNMLSPDGPIGDAITGLRNTADEEYDPDIPVKEAKLSKRQLQRIIKEEKRKLLNEQHELSTSPHSAKAVADMIHQRLDGILAEVLDGLPVEELEMLSTMQVTGPGGWDEATQALAKVALSQLDDGGHYRGS